MGLLCTLNFLCFIALSCLSSVTAERKVLCTSENVSIWYTFEGPLYYLSMSGSPCSLGVTLYTVTYTVIPMFTMTRVGYHGVVHYKGQPWIEHSEPDVICEDFKLCYIIKGETLHGTFPFYVKKMTGPEGEYQIYLTVNVVDELENIVTLQFNCTIEVKNGNKNVYFPQLGGT